MAQRFDYLLRGGNMSDQEALIALQYIQRYGDREAFRQAGLLKQWLLPNTSERSAAF